MYREKIAKLAPGYDPAHVEACLLARGISVESMSSNHFEAAVGIAQITIDTCGTTLLDRLAKSFGLKPRSLRKP